MRTNFDEKHKASNSIGMREHREEFHTNRPLTVWDGKREMKAMGNDSASVS